MFFQILFLCIGVGGGIMFGLFSQHGDSTLWKYKEFKWMGLGLLIFGCLGEVYLMLTPGMGLSILEMANKTMLAYFFGYGFSVFAGDFFIYRVMQEVHGGLEKDRFWQWQTRVLGIVERVLYTASLLYGKPEFIALWLILKTTVQWGRWTQDIEYTEDNKIEKIPGRTIYNVFLIGNGLSIIYGLTGAKLIRWCQNSYWSAVVVVPLALVIGCLILGWLGRRRKVSNKEGEESPKKEDKVRPTG